MAIELKLELDNRRRLPLRELRGLRWRWRPQKIHFLLGLFNCHWRRWMNEWMPGWQEDGAKKSEAKQIEIKVGGMSGMARRPRKPRKMQEFFRGKLPEGVARVRSFVLWLVIYLLVYFQHFFGAFIRSCSAFGPTTKKKRGDGSKLKEEPRKTPWKAANFSSAASELKIICKSNWKRCQRDSYEHNKLWRRGWLLNLSAAASEHHSSWWSPQSNQSFSVFGLWHGLYLHSSELLSPSGVRKWRRQKAGKWVEAR